MQFNFLREAVNVLAGIVLGGLGYVLSQIFTSMDVGLGSLSIATAGYLNMAVFGLILAGAWLGDLGGQYLDARKTLNTPSATV